MGDDIVAAVEAHISQFRVALVKERKILEIGVIERTTPQHTLDQCVHWLKERKFCAIGITSFGPTDSNRKRDTFGTLLHTPLKDWVGVNLVKPFRVFNKPIAIETDVTGGAVGHQFLYDCSIKGASLKPTCAFLTVGLGVGVGVVVNGQPHHGLINPEMGHISLGKKAGDDFEGTCPFHKECFEGLCSIPSLCKRKNISLDQFDQIKDDDEVWDLVAHYISLFLMTIYYTLSPHFIILGGGIFGKRKFLVEKVISHLREKINGYLSPPSFEDLIRPSPFGEEDIWLQGAAAIALHRYKEKNFH